MYPMSVFLEHAQPITHFYIYTVLLFDIYMQLQPNIYYSSLSKLFINPNTLTSTTYLIYADPISDFKYTDAD